MTISLATSLLLFSLFLNVYCTLGMTYYAYRIWNMEVTPEYTWVFKFMACVLQVVQLGFSVIYIWDINAFIQTFPAPTLVFSYTLSAVRTGLIFLFVSRVYYTLVQKFPLQSDGNYPDASALK